MFAPTTANCSAGIIGTAASSAYQAPACQVTL